MGSADNFPRRKSFDPLKAREAVNFNHSPANRRNRSVPCPAPLFFPPMSLRSARKFPIPRSLPKPLLGKTGGTLGRSFLPFFHHPIRVIDRQNQIDLIRLRPMAPCPGQKDHDVFRERFRAVPLFAGIDAERMSPGRQRPAETLREIEIPRRFFFA